MQEWFEIRDFSQGMNQQLAVTGSDAPWDLQDVILSERPELRRRGPFTDRDSDSNLNVIEGLVLKADTYNYLGTSATVAVSAVQRTLSGNTVWAVLISIIEANQPAVKKWFATHTKASLADIAGAWTDPESARLDERPDAFIVTTDVGTYVVSYTGPNDNEELDWWQIASSYYTFDRTNSLKGNGFKTCATVNGFSFLGRRYTRSRTGTGNTATNAKGAARRIWWSKEFNSESWKETAGDVGRQGGSLVLPFTQGIQHFTDLDGNLVIFTRNQIHTLSPTSSNPAEWNLQQRAGIGTTYPRSVSRYEDSLIFANADGVFQFSGYETISLTEDSIGDLYRKQFYQGVSYSQANESAAQRDVVGIVIGDYYLLSLNELTGYALCCHLPTGSWVRFSNIPMLAASRSPASDDRAFGFMKDGSNSRIVRLDRMFVPDGTSQLFGQDTVEAEQGTRGPTMQVELRRYSQGALGIPKLWRSLAVLYDTKAVPNIGGGNLAGELTVAYSPTPDKDESEANWTNLQPLPSTSQVTEKRQAFAAVGNALGLRIRQTGFLGRTNIASIELGYKELRRGRA